MTYCYGSRTRPSPSWRRDRWPASGSLAPRFPDLSPLACRPRPGWAIPDRARQQFVDWSSGPVIYTSARSALFVALLIFRRFFTEPLVAWACSTWPCSSRLGHDRLRTSAHRHQARQRADRDADLLGRLLHLAGAAQGRQSTTTASRTGEPPLEKLDDEKVLVWPDLVYTELIAMIIVTVILVVWAIVPARPRWNSRPPAPRRPTRRRRRGTSSACRKCSSTSIRGWPAWCCRP